MFSVLPNMDVFVCDFGICDNLNENCVLIMN